MVTGLLELKQFGALLLAQLLVKTVPIPEDFMVPVTPLPLVLVPVLAVWWGLQSELYTC